MFTRTTVAIALSGLLLLAMSGVAVAQGPAARLARMKNVLALTDQQVNDVKTLLRKHHDAAFPIRQELRARNHELQNALDTPEPNPNTVGQIVIASRALRTQLRTLNARLQSDIAARLTPEQKQKLNQLRARLRRTPRG
jgi:Spy/CpxP family protein refolding chaperone